MGLGKTVELLALVTAHRFKQQQEQEDGAQDRGTGRKVRIVHTPNERTTCNKETSMFC